MEPEVPHVQYTSAGDVTVAYQVLGRGPRDVLYIPGFSSHLEIQWEHPAVARFFRRLASFSRLILFDRRGTGLSERGVELHGFEDVLEDVTAVLDAVGSEGCALIGNHMGGRFALLYAATFPERVSAVVTIAGHPATIRDEDYPWGTTEEELKGVMARATTGWGSPEAIEMFLAQTAPSVADDPFTRSWWIRLIRSSMTPRETVADLRAITFVDIRKVLPTIHTPTLILHRTGDQMARIEASRYMADRIPDARFVELAGVDDLPYFGDQDELLDEVQEFLTGARATSAPDRVLATVMFTDIVGSTTRAAEIGDRRWRELIRVHNDEVRRALVRFNGREVHSTGDGFLATFDGPARAIRCGLAAIETVRRIGLDIRVGVHTGEVEVLGDDIGGIGVHIGARVGALAGDGEVWVSQTVKDLVAGSGIEFEDRGTHALKGVPDEWRLFRVVPI